MRSRSSPGVVDLAVSKVVADAESGMAPTNPANRDRGDRLWTQTEAADYLNVSARYLRDASCPKVLLPGNGPGAQPLVRYMPDEVRAWARAWGREMLTTRRIR